MVYGERTESKQQQKSSRLDETLSEAQGKSTQKERLIKHSWLGVASHRESSLRVYNSHIGNLSDFWSSTHRVR